MLRPGEILIGGHNWHRHANVTPPDQSKGLIPRNYKTHPRGFYAGLSAVDFPTFSNDELMSRLKDQIARKAQLSNVMLDANVPVLDQNGRGYCWAHSTTGAVQAARAVMGEPVIGLSAYSVACKIKNFRDEGGWGAQSADFVSKNGVCDEEHWPQRGTQRSLDNDANWKNAANYKITYQIADLQAEQYDRSLSFAQFCTLWTLGCPTVNDYNWWSHSVMGSDLVDGVSSWNQCRDDDTGKLLTLSQFELCWSMDEDDPMAGLGCRIRNSWGASYGQNGFGVIAGRKAIPDSGLGVLLVTPYMPHALAAAIQQLAQAV